MEELTGKQYMMSAIRRQYADRFPTTVLIGPYCSRLTRYTVKEILTDARKSAEAHLAFHDRFHPDSIIIYNDIYLEAEAVGAQLAYPDDGISHPKSIVLEEKSSLAKLRVPDPKKDGRLPYYLELCERVSSQVRKTTAIGLGHSGPWNLAMHLRGVEQLLDDTMDDPDFVHELMTFTTRVVRDMGDALVESGFAPSIGEACASCTLISPHIYREFIKPYHKSLRDYFKSKKIPMAIHICGYIDPIMKDLVETGCAALSIDSPTSLEKMVADNEGKAVIIGNVPTPLFVSGTPEQIETEIRKCVDIAADKSGFILASGCEVPPNAKKELVQHFCQYAHTYGRYDRRGGDS